MTLVGYTKHLQIVQWERGGILVSYLDFLVVELIEDVVFLLLPVIRVHVS